MGASAKVAFATAWAFLAGVSVPFGLSVQVMLNKKAVEQGLDTSFHAFYVAQLGVAMGGLQLMVPSFQSKSAWSPPKQWWSCLGGVCTLLSFVTISATPVLGQQAALMVQLLGMLGTYFLLDILDGTVALRDVEKPLGFAVVLLGVGVDNLDTFRDTLRGERQVDGFLILNVVGIFLSGVGFALQSKCNGALAQEIGGPARAAMVSALVNNVAGAPIAFYISYCRGVPLTLDAGVWPLWLALGFQSAFFIKSMAMLPKLLGFTTCYFAVMSSKLFFGALADQFGLSGPKIPLSANRIASLLLVMLGAYTFNVCAKHRSAARELAASAIDEENPMITGDDGVVKLTAYVALTE